MKHKTGFRYLFRIILSFAMALGLIVLHSLMWTLPGKWAPEVLVLLALVCYFALSKINGPIESGDGPTKDEVAAILAFQKFLAGLIVMPDRIETNAAMDQLIATNGEDRFAARAVVYFALNLEPYLSEFSSENVRRRRGSDDQVTGFTKEAGDVSVKSGSGDSVEIRSRGAIQTRVGQYKIWRDIQHIHFQHFWESDIETNLNPLVRPTEFVIQFRCLETGIEYFFMEVERTIIGARKTLITGKQVILVQCLGRVLNGDNKGLKILLGEEVIKYG